MMVANFGVMLAICMALTLIMASLLTAAGQFIKYSFGKMLSSFTEELSKQVNLKASINAAGQNICPVLKYNSDVRVEMGEWTNSIGSFIILTGVIVFVMSVLGTVGGLAHHKVLLLTTVVALLASLVLQAQISYWLLFDSSGFHEGAKDELLNYLIDHYEVEAEKNIFSKAANGVMLWWRCCGVKSVRDFRNLTFVEKLDWAVKEYHFKVSPACCRRELWNSDADIVFYTLRQCAIMGYENMEYLNTKGCYDEILEHLKTVPLFTVVPFLCMGWHLILLFLALMALVRANLEKGFGMRKTTLKYDRPEADETEFLEEDEPKASQKMVRFIPFARTSSLSATQEGKVRSTEIW